MNFTLHQLRIFLKVVQTHSITKAADELFMTQPAVSIQLKNFQEQFDIPLTEVIGKQLHITDFGREIAQLANQVMEEIDAIHFKTQAYKGKLTGRLKIASASTGKYVLPYFLSDFVHRHPGIDLVLDVTNKTQVIESLQRNEIDFALVSVVPEGLPVKEELLIENKLYLVGGRQELSGEIPLIYREPGSATRMAMEAYFEEVGHQGRKRMALTSNEAVKQAVIAGLGYSIMPLIGLRNELLSQEVRIIPSPGLPIRTEWRLIWQKSKKLSPVALAYLAYLREEKMQVVEGVFRWYVDFEG